MTNPMISIVILTYNNSAVLRRCISSVLTLDFDDLEIIVVDNASTDDTVAVVEAEFSGQVRLISRAVNSPVSARNQGYRESKGEFVLSLDHDMIFQDTQILHRALEIFRQLPEVGLLAFKICGEQNPDLPLTEHWWYPAPIEEAKDTFFYTNYFSEGAAFFRAAAIRDTGGYDENFFYFAENLDLSLKLADRGWQTLYCPSPASVELIVSQHSSQTPSKGNYYFMRNRLWVVWKHYSLMRGLVYIVPRIGVAAVRSIRYNWVGHFLRGLMDGIFAPKVIRRERKPLRSSIFREIQRVEGTVAELAVVPVNSEPTKVAL